MRQPLSVKVPHGVSRVATVDLFHWVSAQRQQARGALREMSGARRLQEERNYDYDNT